MIYCNNGDWHKRKRRSEHGPSGVPVVPQTKSLQEESPPIRLGKPLSGFIVIVDARYSTIGRPPQFSVSAPRRPRGPSWLSPPKMGGGAKKTFFPGPRAKLPSWNSLIHEPDDPCGSNRWKKMAVSDWAGGYTAEFSKARLQGVQTVISEEKTVPPGRRTVIGDEWMNLDNAHRVLEASWVGKTCFEASDGTWREVTHDRASVDNACGCHSHLPSGVS